MVQLSWFEELLRNTYPLPPLIGKNLGTTIKLDIDAPNLPHAYRPQPLSMGADIGLKGS